MTERQAYGVILASQSSDDGRSQWLQVIFPNGDVMVGCFPQGDTYELLMNGEP